MENLALLGGKPVKAGPFGTGKRFGDAEINQLREALDQNTLFYWAGKKVKEFCARTASLYGAQYAVAASSGTAAIHAALGAVGVSEGDEVIVSPITDMGSLIGILFQNAIPVFADLDPHTYNMDVRSIKSRISDKTKAIVAVHLAGNPSDMDEIMALAEKHNLYVVEDCAQTPLALYKGRYAGTIGHIGCFSTNDFKHISTGDGGVLVTNDEALYKKAFGFADKNYNRLSPADSMRDVEFVAPNYRMTELQGAVGLAQLEKLPGICKRHTAIGDRITAGISGLRGVYPPLVKEGNVSTYWFYMLRINKAEAGTDAEEFAKALNAEGIPCQKGYIPSPVYLYPLFQNRSAYPGTHAPFDSPYYGREIAYPQGLCPVAEEILETAVKLGVNQFYTDTDVEEIITAIQKVARYYTK
jgi:dTDP-4-amino-4,6-dideoxygalactose transaminase